ncbi:MAG: hypothetical protein HYV45_03315, partial [Candidatus Moranbacteria bacterium]|nr:hypothetical protein [Candidatus Moranbacteria bacterium]
FAANVGDACVGSTSGKSGNCIASPYPAQVCLSTNVEDARNNNEACGGNRCYQEVMKYSQVCSE